MHISLNIAGGAPPLASAGLILPQMSGAPSVTGDGRAGTACVADTSDTWSYDGSPASVTQRQYRLMIDGAGAVPPGASASVDIPANATNGGLYQMQLRVQVSQAAGIWSPWQTIASGQVVGVPTLSAASASADGTANYTGSVTTDLGEGLLHWMVSTSPIPPDLGTLMAAENQPISTVGSQAIAGNGLAASNNYHIHFVQEDATGRTSAIVSSGVFTTNEAPVFEPGAFSMQDWSITDLASGGDARLTITALPDDGGGAFRAFYYNIDGGGWVPLLLQGTGSTDLMDVFTDGVATDVRLLAENEIGIGPESAPQSITTTTAPPQFWQITDTGDGRFTLSSAPPPAPAPQTTNGSSGTFAVLS